MIGIIGGTGLYSLSNLGFDKELHVTTPFGEPSAPVLESEVYGKQVFFLPRHGARHQFLPHEVNNRANIFALKDLGVTSIIGISAVGSLRKEIKPGDFSIPDQYFDFVKGNREKTFFGNGLSGHISTAEPVCAELTGKVCDAGRDLGIKVHTNKTYACVDGPRLGTRAESFFLRDSARCDLVGMTNVPEAFLAREAQICYACLTIVTDYDCWLDDPKEHVSVEMVFSRYSKSLDKATSLLQSFLVNYSETDECHCRRSLDAALISKVGDLEENQRSILEVLKI